MPFAFTVEPFLISALIELRIKLNAIDPPIALAPEPAPPTLRLVKVAKPSASTFTLPVVDCTLALSI